MEEASTEHKIEEDKQLAISAEQELSSPTKSSPKKKGKGSVLKSPRKSVAKNKPETKKE